MPVTLDMSTAEPINAPPPDSGVTLDMSTAQPIDGPPNKNLWDKANTGLIAPESFTGMSPEKMAYESQPYEGESPVHAALRIGSLGVVKDVGGILSSLTSPVSAALAASTMGTSEAAAPVMESLPRLVPALKVLQTGAGALFGAQGAKQALTPAQPGESTADALSRRLQGAAGAALGTAGTLSGMPEAVQAAKDTASGLVSPELLGNASDLARSSAESNLEQVLGATTKKLKAIASDKLVPGMLDRGIVANSRQGLNDIATQGVQKYGQQVGDAIQAATDSGVELPTAPIIDQLEALKKSPDYTLQSNKTGATISERGAPISQIQQVQDMIAAHGDTIRPDDLIAARRFIDDAVAKKKMAFLADDTKGFEAQAQEGASNVLRGVINDNFPEIADANNEYSFHKNLQTVTDATLQRTASQSDIVRSMGRVVRGGGTGAAIGGAVGGPVGAAAGLAIGEGGELLHNSTAYRTRAANLQNRLSTFLKPSDIPYPEGNPSYPEVNPWQSY